MRSAADSRVNHAVNALSKAARCCSAGSGASNFSALPDSVWNRLGSSATSFAIFASTFATVAARSFGWISRIGSSALLRNAMS